MIWESPTTPPAPKPLAFVLGGGLILVGLVISMAVVPMLLNAANDKLDRNGGIAGGVVGLIMITTGVYVIWDARSALQPKGVQFFERGVEFGPPKTRQRYCYHELDAIELEPLESNPKFDKALAGAKLALSIAALNPHRIGYALGELAAEKVDAFALIVPPNESEFRVAIFGGFHKEIESAIHNSRSPQSS